MQLSAPCRGYIPALANLQEMEISFMSTTAFPPSSCKWQTPLLVLGGLLAVVFILQLIDHFVVRPAFLQLEHREAIEDNNRVKAALAQEFQSLSCHRR